MDITLKIALIGAIALIIGALIKLLGDLISKGSSGGLIFTVIIIVLALLGSGAFVIFLPAPPPTSPTSSEQSTAITCPYQGTTDFQTFKNLKLAEQEAVITKNLDIIKSIFTKDAVTESVSGNQRWTNVVEHYQDNFNADVQNVTLSDFQIVKQEYDKAWVSEKDSGSVILSDTKELIEWHDHTAHLIFSKVEGCWLISYFATDAESQPFP